MEEDRVLLKIVHKHIEAQKGNLLQHWIRTELGALESHYQNDFEITKMVSVAKPFKIETHVQVLPEFHFGGSLGNSFLLKQLLERFFFLRVLGNFSLNFEKKRDSCSLATISNLSNGNFYDVIMAAKPLCDAVLFLWRSIMVCSPFSIMVCSPFKEKKTKKKLKTYMVLDVARLVGYRTRTVESSISQHFNSR